MSIKVYTTPECRFCDAVKTFIEEKGFEYEEIDVGNNQILADQMIREKGQIIVPLVEIDGEVILGFDRQKIESLLYIN